MLCQFRQTHTDNGTENNSFTEVDAYDVKSSPVAFLTDFLLCNRHTYWHGNFRYWRDRLFGQKFDQAYFAAYVPLRQGF